MKTLIEKSKYLVLLVMIFCSSCQVDNDQTISLVFPVLAECKNKTLAYLDNHAQKKAGKLSYTYIEVSKPVASHEEVVGFIKLSRINESSSPHLSASELLDAVANTIFTNCYPEVKVSAERDDGAFEFIGRTVERNEREGVNKYYIKVDKNRIDLYFSEKRHGD